MASNTLQANQYVNKTERAAFYAAACFRDMSYGLVAPGFLLVFYQQVLGLEGWILTVLLLLQKIWDGVNDPLMGVVFDKRSTSLEKARPVFKFTPIPIAACFILMFTKFDFPVSEQQNFLLRAVIVFVTYVIFEGLHTLNGTAFMSYYNSISPNLEERNDVIARSRLFSNIGSGGITGAIPILISLFVENKGDAGLRAQYYIFLISALIIAALFVLYNYFMHTYVKARVVTRTDTTQFSGNILIEIFKNQPFLLMMLSNAILFIFGKNNVSMYFFRYNMGGSFLQTVTGAAYIPGLLIATAFTPKLIARYGTKKVFVACLAAMAGLNLLMLIGGIPTGAYTSGGVGPTVLVTAVYFLLGIPECVRQMTYWSMIADTVDYGEWKTGHRNDGMIYAAEGMTGKITGGIGSAISVQFLKAIGFKADADTQSPSVQKTLFYIPQIATVVLTALAILPYARYKLGREEHQEILDELKTRKEHLEGAEVERAEAMVEGVA
ncbi:MAG: MFS transporter [Oscillospiraceae bacterium]|jgi:Na+/melibiose symporter-like transporter|nr:MFS transporter [Oscillospiraceae bacterium]